MTQCITAPKFVKLKAGIIHSQRVLFILFSSTLNFVLYRGRTLRKYDKEFKINSVKLCLEQGNSHEEVAKNLGLPKSTLYTWIQEFKANGEEGFRSSGNVKLCNEEVQSLKKQLADVTQERDILKKAVAIFSRPKP